MPLLGAAGDVGSCSALVYPAILRGASSAEQKCQELTCEKYLIDRHVVFSLSRCATASLWWEAFLWSHLSSLLMTLVTVSALPLLVLPISVPLGLWDWYPRAKHRGSSPVSPW